MKISIVPFSKLYLLFISALSFILFSCDKKDASAFSVKSATASDNIVTNGLAAWYTFDGDMLDHSGNGNNPSFASATPVAGRNGQPNTAYKFDGASNYIQIPSSTTLQATLPKALPWWHW